MKPENYDEINTAMTRLRAIERELESFKEDHEGGAEITISKKDNPKLFAQCVKEEKARLTKEKSDIRTELEAL